MIKSCLTFGNPMDCSPPGSSVHGISQARILEWVAISFSRGVGCHFLLQGIFQTQGSNLHLLHWQADSLPLSHLESPSQWKSSCKMCSSLPSPTTQVTSETRYCLYKIYHSDFVFTGNVNLCTLLPNSNSLLNHCLRKTHFLTLQ